LAKRSLTDAAVKRLKPPTKGQIDVFDQGYPGLALRVSYGGGKTFVYFYKLGRRLRRMSLGRYPSTTLTEAREAWRKARQDAQKGRDPSTARKRKTGATDFPRVLDEWLRRDQAENRTKDAIKRLIEKDTLPAWEYRQVADLDRRDILDVIDTVVDRGSPITARRLQAHLHRFFKWCSGRGIIATNPMADLPKPGSETKRDRVLSDHELVTVYKAAKDLGWPFGPAVQLLILTGARREEIGGLRWSELVGMTDMDAAEIKLEGARTKNNEPHTIPLSAPATTLVQKLPRMGNSDFVFTTTGRTPVSGWSRAKSKLNDGIQSANPWTIHDLRRTVATGLQKLGISLQVIEAVLGHVAGSRAGVVGIYQRHSFDAEKRAALEAWGAHVMALVEGRELGKVLPMRGKQ
jgi:integrase